MADVAIQAGAKIVNVVPPAHVWERPDALAILDDLISYIQQKNLLFVFTRIDASYPPDAKGERFNYLYGNILTERGVMPDGQRTRDYFCTTVGKADYAAWMKEETHFYARRYGHLRNLWGINLGPFSEPFVSQRGGFLEYSAQTRSYEITQYTESAEAEWHRWLPAHFNSVDAMNSSYGTAFRSFDSVPLPRNEADPVFKSAPAAYFDFVRCINDWFVDLYEQCRGIWHSESKRPDVPFIIQISGYLPEKMYMGRPAFAAFDLPDWIGRADAVGLSLYTNSGYQDLGHESITSCTRLLSLALLMHKKVFILEGGAEIPLPSFNKDELQFFSDAGRSLRPVTYIYEFLKNPFNEPDEINSGRLIDTAGNVRVAVLKYMRKLIRHAAGYPLLTERAKLIIVDDPSFLRTRPRLGKEEMAFYQLAAHFPMVWIPVSHPELISSEAMVWNPRTGFSRPSQELDALLDHIPFPDSPQRAVWIRQFSNALSHARH